MIAVTTAAVVVAVAIAVAVGLSGGSDDDGTVAQPSSETDSDQRTGDSSDGEPGDDGSGDGTPDAAAGEATLLPEAMGGQAAIDALGDNLQVVAQRNDMTADELRALLLRDDDLRVSPAGTLLYSDTMTPPPPATPPAED